MKRRKWIALTAASVAGAPLLLPDGAIKAMGQTRAQAHAASTPVAGSSKASFVAQSERAVRIAHITDTHLQPGNRSEYWTRVCLEQLHGLSDRPDIIFWGGDIINDALRRTENEVADQWEIWSRLAGEVELPVRYAIGNHDVWGIEEAKNDPRYGKNWPTQLLGLSNRYYDFALENWHVIVLDGTHTNSEGGWYTARLDEEQFAWLRERLGTIPPETPVMVFAHIPILCAAAYFDGENERTGNWVVPGAWMHIDARRIVELFYEHANVRLTVSGHIHLLDNVLYNGSTHCCNGAVSGRWWGGSFHQTPPGYALVDLYRDGSFEVTYHRYGWEE